LKYAVEQENARFLWALEKNEKAIAFYHRHGFRVTEERKFEEGTTEYLVRMELSR
jgi:putative acetyltransferase